MISPAILPMRSGEKPTEPGWYVVKHSRGRCNPNLAEIEPFGENKMLVACMPETWEQAALSEFIFIARIFPDRIGQK